MRSRAVACSFCGITLVRLSPDSARTKNTMANMIPSQKIARTALDFFILFLTPFLRASVPDFLYTQTESRLTLCDSAPGILRRGFQERQAESFVRKATEPTDLHRRNVTELSPTPCADAFFGFKPATSRRANGREQVPNVR